MNTFKKTFYLLNSSQRRQAGILLIMILIMALLDMIGVASILPFMTVLTNPELIETNAILNYMFHISKILGVENDRQFLIALGFLVFILLIISLVFKAVTTFLQIQFVQMQLYSISKSLVERYLYQPYSWFLGRHTADLGKTILSEVQQVVGSAIRPLLDLIAKSMITIAIITLLIIADPKLALLVGSILGGIYTAIFYFIKNYLKINGISRLKSNQSRFAAVSEAFGAAKEVKVGRLEHFYVKIFSEAAKTYAQTHSTSQIISQLPRFFLEAIAFGGVLLMILYMMTVSGSFNKALPIISLYVFAGYRLIPAIQQIYSSFTSLTFVGPSLDKLNDDIKSLKFSHSEKNEKKITFEKMISLKNIYYHYPGASIETLTKINFDIPIKSTIGLVGTTGSGKTTTVDIILGLLKPQKGCIEIDGEPLTQLNIRSWQSYIGYVPQNIYLADDTVAANIAFGVKKEKIDFNNVEKVSKIANLHNFVQEGLPNKYNTKIGERGVRISGGQRQRIGIARAIYNNPKVLVLDEATSALDNETEKVVMNAVNNLSKKITIILIAHRLNTTKNCDIIITLDKGKILNIKKSGDFIK